MARKTKWPELLSTIVATIAAAAATAAAVFSWQQANITSEQTRFAGIQARPYVRYRPYFEVDKDASLKITMVSENFSPVPAIIIYDHLTTWTDGITSGAFLFSKNTDVLYEKKAGVADLPRMSPRLEEAVLLGDAQLQIATCIVYGSLDSSDKRKWLARALYEFSEGSLTPLVRISQETEVPATVSECDSKTIRDEWAITQHLQSKLLRN